MKTVRCHEIADDITTVTLDEVDLPEPGPREVQVRIMACAVNFPDILMIQGKYQFAPPLPFAPGGEFAGDVIAVADDVTEFKPGDRVSGGNRYGGFAEAINADAGVLRHIPEGVPYEKAASYSTAYLTAYVALKIRGHLQAGETLLVHGATGGVGLAAVDVGKFMGAKVIATGGTDEKLAIVKKRGADHIINYTQANGSLGGFREKVKQLTDGNGADVIYDPVGGTVFDESMRCINWNGRILTIGFTSGVWPKAAVNHILIKQISVIGVRAGEIGRRDPELGKQTRDDIYRLLAEGSIDPYICASFPLEQAIDAMNMLVDRKVVGKVVVTANGYKP
ncbi:MAG: NADPH:quinone oxidoreductase family protein [Pseudomonadales bacterium]|nr:NADPH:quinone oxidoreductase family protein [Pseudomonadales bacterium]MBO6594496.1 NADPH:quinone oxidoreductase family protein [Pseudomonadales bacterium]MBO6656673.1 NADPH:quinone oxidoreductase family protein [Pseudomonadales bacterium]MBO6700999.1 NADPH:quinone oxidoreductase family protein [Pseudomonadales bacterium]MBO6821943.1 NADPH:quinone oxidoreductase family protein [Pseudomonadales bacterium]